MDKDAVLFDEFVTDLEALHHQCRAFHKKWHNVTSEIEVSPEQRAKLQGIWDQHDAWYEDNKDA